jgi:hypothetical protein
MTISIGFVLLTHHQPQQIYRLIAQLNKMFNYPPIVCHHDFSKCDLAIDHLPKNISFVRPHLQPKWADFSIVEATIKAIELMYQSANAPDWFILLSGSDYPIKTAKQILDDLSSGEYDAYINHEQVQYKVYRENPKISLIWQKLAYQRYCSLKLFSIPSSNKKLYPNGQEIRVEYPLLTKLFFPFFDKFNCFVGDQWFCANQRAAEHILKFHNENNAITSHYRCRLFADESYFQTILANAPQLNLKNDNYRHVIWPPRSAHPKTMVMEDLPRLLSSSAHFARKFNIEIDSDIFDQLDIITLGE